MTRYLIYILEYVKKDFTQLGDYLIKSVTSLQKTK